MRKEFFNVQKGKLKGKEYSIFIGISLGVLKPMTKKMAKNYLRWALRKSKGKVVILIADEIAKYNYKIFSKYSPGKSIRAAMKEGEKYKSFFQEVISSFSTKDKSRILLLRWNDIWDENLERIRKKLKKKYDEDRDFRKVVISFVKMYADKRGKVLSEEKLDYLSQYILAELPTLLDGVHFDNVKYDLLLYPTFAHSGMSDFVTKIESGNAFPDLKKELGLDKSVAIAEFHLPIVKK